MAIIGGNDMDYIGRARNPVFTKKINGTHTLTFEMPDRYFDSKIGDYIHNDLIDAIFPECKIKYKYKGEWYEFNVKNVSEAKKHNSYMKTFTCSDAFIDELARNGYGITFDEELYNNVEEIGTFSDTILKDSVWEYDSHLNWGDFTEYTEEKLFKIPLSLFGGSLTAHKVNFELGENYEILNIFTGDTRPAEMGDDLARENGKFWDQYKTKAQPLLGDSTIITNEQNDYIYVPYSQLDFCYVSSDSSGQNGLEEAFAATEYPATYGNKGYAIAPNTIDPNQLIQFMYIPKNEKIEIDEAGLILNKNFTYVMTVKEWNDQLNSSYFYKFEGYKENGYKKKVLTTSFSSADYIYGNKAAYYEDYLTEVDESSLDSGIINNVDPYGNSYLTILGKKFSIVDRTEINISEDIDQYVKVYNNSATEYSDLYISEDWTFDSSTDADYRVCSKEETRQIVPQLARNLLQNSINIQSTTGWEIMESFLTSQKVQNAKLTYCCLESTRSVEVPQEGYSIKVQQVDESYLVYNPSYYGDIVTDISERNAALNFGIVGQEKELEKGKNYVLGIKLRALTQYTKDKIKYNSQVTESALSEAFIRIGSGKMISDGDYTFDPVLYIDVPIRFFNRGNDLYEGYVIINLKHSYSNPYLAIYSRCSYELVSCEFFEAYTKGVDQFDSGFFRYSGRDLFSGFTPNSGVGYNYSGLYNKDQLLPLVIFEDDVMPGDTYAYQHYFIQKLQLKDSGQSFDTFMAKKYLDENAENDATTLPLNASQYTEDDYDIITNYIDLNNCQYYNAAATATAYDCKCGSSSYDKVCLYQKYGYCPYRFQTEKHCRRIRTLKGEKSNRFNLTQELGKVFKVYPVYFISHGETGKVLTQAQAAELGTREITEGRANWMDKRVFYITEKGKENKLGFRYGKNLSGLTRTINSDKIVSKLYVLDVDSDISKTGLSSIKTAEDNPSKDNFIIDFSYYIAQGLLDKEKTEADLYGKNDNDLGFLKTLGYFNIQYDKLSNWIINLSAASFTELEANLQVNLTGIETAQKRLRQLEKIMSNYTVKKGSDYLENSTYQSYQYEYIEQNAILVQLIEDTFYTNGVSIYGTSVIPAKFLDQENLSVEDIKEKWVDTHNYNYGILGQYNKEYNQIKEWRKEQAAYLKRINQLSTSFYRKYEPFLKEGTWSDGNYIDDNAYYFGALDVAKQGALPKVNYSISVCDIEPLYQEGDYDFDIADTTYVEDIGMFGINAKTGLPNRLKTIVSAITESPDNLRNNRIEIQNFTTQFEDLFQQVTASVQSLTFNENIYKRSSNFTSLQSIETSSLQGALDKNNLTLVKTQENNIEINQTGQSGSDINNHNNKYMLNGQGLFFSNNGGQSWNVAVSPNGINADYIKAGTIDTNKIRIVDGQYMYFSWDRNGITAYRDPKTVSAASAFLDYAQFNKYGLSLVENGQIKLRAGYSFIGDAGKADTEQEISSDSKIGFYLYNSAGIPIFATENSSNSSSAAKETARINLIGEMLVTNDTEVSNYQGYKYGGTRYIVSSGSYYNIGNSGDTFDSAYLTPNLTIQGTTATYVIGDSPLTAKVGYAAAIYYFNPYLTEITVKENNEDAGTVFSSPVLTQEKSHQLGRMTHESTERFLYFDYYYVVFDGITGHRFVIIRDEANNKDIYKPLVSLGNLVGTMFLTHDSESAISANRLNATSLSGIYLDELYQDGYKYYKKKSIATCYELAGFYYTQLIGNVVQSGDGSVSLYLNNRTDLQSANTSGNSRLFVCCNSNKNDNIVHNIFSILKDGSLHMGGTIQGATSSATLPDQITFNNDESLVISNGRLFMSFDSIVDRSSGQSIVNYMTNELNAQSAQIIGEITGRSHNHGVSWIRNTGGIIDGTDTSFTDVFIKLKIGEGEDTYISLYNLLNMAGFYNGVYTDYASV